MNKNYYAVIMAGGIGSRFWPMSRCGYPKQFLDVLNTGSTLLQATYQRFADFVLPQNIYVLTADEYLPIVQAQLPNLPAANIIGEPERKNTAPAIAYISFRIFQQNPAANLIIAPSDHLIADQTAFRRTCQQALAFTQHNSALVTIGIEPTYPNTGYGYIQREAVPAEDNIFPVQRFTEKPDVNTAAAFIRQGDYLWNAGIFVWKAADIINAFLLHCPAIHHLFVNGLAYLYLPQEKEAMAHVFRQCQSISIDYAIMEKASNVFVIPAALGWSDLGTWNSAWENFAKDAAQNAVAGNNALLLDTNGCIVHSTDPKLVVVGGLEDLIVVNTPDVLLVCKKENEQAIKEYVEKVKKEKGAVYL